MWHRVGCVSAGCRTGLVTPPHSHCRWRSLLSRPMHLMLHGGPCTSTSCLWMRVSSAVACIWTRSATRRCRPWPVRRRGGHRDSEGGRHRSHRVPQVSEHRGAPPSEVRQLAPQLPLLAGSCGRAPAQNSPSNRKRLNIIWLTTYTKNFRHTSH